MLTYPNIDPVAVSLGPLQVHWYGLMYLLAFLFAWGLATHRAKQRDGWNPEMVSDLIFYGALGLYWADVLAMYSSMALINSWQIHYGCSKFGQAA